MRNEQTDKGKKNTKRSNQKTETICPTSMLYYTDYQIAFVSASYLVILLGFSSRLTFENAFSNRENIFNIKLKWTFGAPPKIHERTQIKQAKRRKKSFSQGAILSINQVRLVAVKRQANVLR